MIECVVGAGWGPLGRRVAFCNKNGEIQVLDSQSGDTLQEWRHPVNVSAWALSPDAKEMAIASKAASEITIVNVDTESVTRTLVDSRLAELSALAWSPDGSRLATVGEGTRTLWETETGRLLDRAAELDMRALSWSTSGDRLASVGYEETVQIWRSATTTKPRLLAGDHLA